jgi:hypothetical protein
MRQLHMSVFFSLRQFKIGLSCCFLTFIIISSYGQAAKDILNNYFDVVSNGNFAKWNEIKSIRATSVNFYSVNGFENGFEDFNRDEIGYSILYKEWPDKQKEELYKDSLFNNLTSEFFFIGNTRTILLGNLPPMKVPADKSRSFEFYPVKINGYVRDSKTIRNNGLKILPGKSIECYEIEIETKKERHWLLFNSKTYLLEAISFPEQKIFWYLSEYKEFEGYLIPSYILGVKGGVVYEWCKYKSFEFNTKIDPSKFIIP